MRALFDPLKQNQKDQCQREKHGDMQSALQVWANQSDESEARCRAIRVDQGRKENGKHQAHRNKQCLKDFSPRGNCTFFPEAFSGQIHLHWRLHISCILEGAEQRFATLIGIGQKTEKFNSQTIFYSCPGLMRVWSLSQLENPASSISCKAKTSMAATVSAPDAIKSHPLRSKNTKAARKPVRM